ncbi:MAG: succinyl-diaminopimelate desuccinylase [Parasphingorhabdus sp.]|jgi:succinyl-diaminopimelate desuccinylase
MSIQINQSRIKQVLEDLVGFDTQNPPGREVEAAHYIHTELHSMGCRVESLDFLPGRTNVVGVFENGPGPVFAYNTHIDVVPAGDVWNTNPFKLKEKARQFVWPWLV